jgi:hypothetical protein
MHAYSTREAQGHAMMLEQLPQHSHTLPLTYACTYHVVVARAALKPLKGSQRARKAVGSHACLPHQHLEVELSTQEQTQ